VELSGDARYNHYRHEVLAFLYERQRKVEDIGAQKKAREAASTVKVRLAS
jgi:nitrate/nitrite transport system ATP-binding protein